MRYVDIGILLADDIEFVLSGSFACNGNNVNAGSYEVKMSEGFLLFMENHCNRLHFVPSSPDCRFTLCNVVIGLGFHWERKQKQAFEGELIFFVEDGRIRAVNRIPVECYLKSVISSEMSSGCSLEFLKAHTVISRSWLYAQLYRSVRNGNAKLGYEHENEIIRWYAREDHVNFDLCADDHCQRYQGVAQTANPKVVVAVDETKDQVLVHDGRVCDARFSKCCGGVTERFSACWEDEDKEYLQAFRDTATKESFADLTDEAVARSWIEAAPESFCNTSDKAVLSQVLNGYDCETTDFYRWQVEYTQSELSRLVCERSGIDFGTIEALQPVERAASGRLVRLRIVGSKRTVVVGKELEIRRWLSSSHLYSSAFVVDTYISPVTNETVFLLKGAGWGHGVGLCQIGAAMMGEKGYSYREILQHYYPETILESIENLIPV